MKGHTRIMVIMLLVGLLVMTGCERQYTDGEEGQTDTESRSETGDDTVSDTQQSEDGADMTEETETAIPETNPATVREKVETEKVTEGNVQNMTVFESRLGYQVVYDETMFEYNRTGDYDEIVLKGQTFSSKPLVFFAAMKIHNDEIPDVISHIFTESAAETVIGQEDYTAICQPTVEQEDGSDMEVHHNQYLVRLASGDALLFEVQWYVENGEDTNAGKVAAMMDSIVINQPVADDTGVDMA